jgi:hypothetical protein
MTCIIAEYGMEVALFKNFTRATRALALVLGLLLTTSAYAGSQSGGKVVQLLPSAQSFTFLADGARSSVPTCAAGAANFWTVDLSTPQGQAIAASIMTAFSTGKNVNIYGTGACPSFQPDREGVFYIVVM